MSFITSRKHPVRRSTSSVVSGTVTATTLFAGMLLACPVMAENASPDAAAMPLLSETKTLSGVTVNATAATDYRVDTIASSKFTQPILDTTQTVSLIGKELIQQQGATTLAEALRNSPGVGTFYVGENGSTSTGDAIYMRGFDTSSSIFVDGVRDLGSISRDVFNIEQVEVFKGPAGTDNGRTAPTGAINLVSKQANLHDSTVASVAYGSGQQRRVTADWNQAISNSAAFRLNVVGQNSGVPGRDAVENNRWGVFPTLAFGLGSATRVYLDYLHIKQDNVPDGGVSTIGLPGYSSPDAARPTLAGAPQVDQHNFYGTDEDREHVEADSFTARLEHDFSTDVALHDTLRWARTSQNYLLTSFMATAANLDTPDLNDPSTWSVARSNPNFKQQVNRIVTNQTNVTANFDTGAIRHNLSAGIELTREKVDTGGLGVLDDSSLPAANLYTPDRHVGGLLYGDTGARGNGITDTEAGYLFDTLKFGRHWQVNAGVRLDHYETDFSSRSACGGRRGPDCGSLPEGSILPAVDASKSDNLVNYKLGVLYKPVSHGSIYGNFAVSAEPPGGDTLALSNRSNSADNPALDPQKARTIEFGTKWDLLGQKLLLTAAVYRTTVSNELVQDPVDTSVYYQIGEKRVQGIELNAVGKITHNWAVSAGFTTMDATVVKGQTVSEDGSDELAYTPRNAFTAWSTYHLPFGLTIGSGARYSGELKRGKDGAIGTPAYTESYWVFDALASYPVNKHFELQLNVYNLSTKATWRRLTRVATVTRQAPHVRPCSPPTSASDRFRLSP